MESNLCRDIVPYIPKLEVDATTLLIESNPDPDFVFLGVEYKRQYRTRYRVRIEEERMAEASKARRSRRAKKRKTEINAQSVPNLKKRKKPVSKLVAFGDNSVMLEVEPISVAKPVDEDFDDAEHMEYLDHLSEARELLGDEASAEKCEELAADLSKVADFFSGCY